MGEIISIGIVELCLISGKTYREGNYIVKPEHDSVSKFCTELTGITPSMVEKQGRPLAKVVETIKNKFGGKRAYVAWGTDADYLRKQCELKGIESPINTAINASLLYMIRTRHNGGQISMLKALNDSGLEFLGKQHNALVDSMNLARLIYTKSLL